jgi:hypothetical protein
MYLRQNKNIKFRIFTSTGILLLLLVLLCENSLGSMGNSTSISSTYPVSGYCWSVYNAIGYCATPGYAYQVVVNGNYAYVADYYSGLQIIDVTNPTVPVEVGSFDSTGSARDLQVIGNYAYIANGESGLQILDISNYSNPTEVGSFSMPGYAQGIQVQGDYAYVAEFSDTTSGLWIIDISNPFSPTFAGFSNSTVPVYDVFINGNYAYVAAGKAGFQIIDISNPSDPIEISQTSLPGFASRIAVNGNYAYVADGYYGMFIIDITSPASPIEVSQWATPDEAVGITLDGNYAYVADYYSGFEIIDISDNSNPYEFSNYVTPERAWDVAISGNYAYIADDDQGLLVIDKLPDPAIATQVTLSGDSNLVTGIDSTGYYQFQNLSFGNYTVVASNDHYIFTPMSYIYSGLSSDENLQNFIGQPANVITFLSNPTGLLVITDLGTFQTPYSYSTVTGSIININTPNPQNVDSTQQLVFDSWSDGGPQSHALQIISDTTLTVSFDTQYYLSTYVNPSGAGNIYANEEYGNIESPNQYWTQYSLVTIYAEPTSSITPFYDWSGDLGGNSSLTTILMDGPKSITANFNFSLETTPPYTISGFCYAFQTAGSYPLIGSYNNNGYLSLGIAKQGNYVYMISENNSMYFVLDVFDVSTPSNPVQVNENQYVMTSHPRWITVNGNYLYVTGVGPLYVYDISTPSNPNFIETYYQYPNDINDAVIVGNYAYLAASNGLQILDISNTTNFQEVGFYPIDGYCWSLVVQGNYAYVAGETGLNIIDISSFSNLTEIGYFNMLGTVYDIKISGNYAYLTNGGLGLRILDITNPTSPQEVGNYALSNTIGVTINGDYAYVSDLNNGVIVVNIQNPQAPVEVNQIGGQNNAAIDSIIDGNYLYISDLGLNIYTIPQPISAVTVSLSGDVVETTATDSTGYYEFSSLNYGNYTVQASMINTAFTPAYYSYAGLSTNEPGQIFYGLSSIAITLDSNPTGLYVELNNISYTTPYTIYTITGYYYVLSVSSTRPAGIGPFNSWSDGGAMTHTIFPTSDTTYTVSFDTQYYLTTQTNPGNDGSVTPVSGWYNPGSIVTCQAYPNFGYKFSDWSGDLSGTTNSQSIIMDGSKTVTANFTLLTAWDNVEGNFDVASDLGYWGFEIPIDTTYPPYIYWISSYQGRSGLLEFQFYDENQEVKMTSKMRFTPDLSNPWYILRITYYMDESYGYMNLIPSILTYSDNTSLQIEEIGTGYLGDPFGQVWSTMDVPLYCHTSSGQLQLIVKNNGIARNFYIDSIELLNQLPSVVTSFVNVNVPYGDFSVASDTTQWAFQIPPGSLNPNGIATVSWIPALAEQTGVLALSFITTYQGVKITSLDTFSVPSGHSSMMSFKVYSPLSDPTAIQIMGILFSFNIETSGIWDIGGYANIGALAGDSWNTVYVPLTSPLNNTDRIQLIVKNTSQFPTTVYLDDIQLYYDPTPVSQSITLLKPTQNIEAELKQ